MGHKRSSSKGHVKVEIVSGKRIEFLVIFKDRPLWCKRIWRPKLAFRRFLRWSCCVSRASGACRTRHFFSSYSSTLSPLWCNVIRGGNTTEKSINFGEKRTLKYTLSVSFVVIRLRTDSRSRDGGLPSSWLVHPGIWRWSISVFHHRVARIACCLFHVSQFSHTTPRYLTGQGWIIVEYFIHFLRLLTLSYVLLRTNVTCIVYYAMHFLAKRG